MPIIYHITTAEAWNNALASGQYEAPSLKEEGFIHCSEAYQVHNILQRYFAGQNNLVKLIIDTGKLENQYVQEWSPTVKDTFPHIYGTINTSAVIAVEPLRQEAV
ncbi:MAG: DUF952 domain-containing protein [Chitinophagaceae bacterium]|nr:DUF952 domain-containing protein [Chitinophagaceae bacterium]